VSKTVDANVDADAVAAARAGRPQRSETRPGAVQRSVRWGKSAAEQAQKSSFLRAFNRYKVQRGSRLAAAMTYSAFLSMFPLLAVAAAVAAGIMGTSGIDRLRDQIERNVPGLGITGPLNSIVANAATIGVISGVLLVWSGLSWVNMTRSGLRTIWRVDDMPGKFVTRKAADVVSLVGLGVTAAASVAATTIPADLAGRLLSGLGVEATAPARAVLWIIGVLVGLLVSTAMFAYLLSGIPRLRIPRGVLLHAAVVGAIAFELAKALLAAYFGGVASRSLYGAFGAPIALLLWFNLTFQLVLGLSAWTAARTEDLLGPAPAAASVPAPAAEG
jgi:membrane protein